MYFREKCVETQWLTKALTATTTKKCKKVGQEVFAELSSLEARGACTTSGKTTGCHINHSNNIQQTQAIASAILPSGGRTVGSTGPRRFDGGNLTTLDALNLDRVVLEGVLEEGVPAPKVLTFEERIVEACVRVCEKLERCREARHYVMSADRCGGHEIIVSWLHIYLMRLLSFIEDEHKKQYERKCENEYD